MAYAEKQGSWRARWKGPDGTLESKSGFRSRKDAEKYAKDQESAIRSNTYADPRGGRVTLTEWVNRWYPALDLEPTTLSNYRYQIEVHILPEFGDRTLASLNREEIAAWEMGIVRRGYKRRTARDARSMLGTILSDAVPQYIPGNPAERKRGRGRKGQRRIARHEAGEKVWPTPLQALLMAERCAALSGRDTDFALILAIAYTGMRWSEAIGLRPEFLHSDFVDIQWKLYELNGRFYKGRPKAGSIRPADLPPFLSRLLSDHLVRAPGTICTCRDRKAPKRPLPEGAEWCTGADFVFLGPERGHFRRSNYSERFFRPAADGWFPARKGNQQPRPAVPVLVNAETAFPGQPLPPWPPAAAGTAFTPPSGRGFLRLVSDKHTGRCRDCGRSWPRRLDGTLISHQTGMRRCPGSGHDPAEDVTLASWLPVLRELTPHGFRHGHKVWMDEDRIPDVLKSERLGHEEPGMRAVYGHVSPAMRADLKAALQERWEHSLRERAQLSPRSGVPVLDALLAAQRPATSKIDS